MLSCGLAFEFHSQRPALMDSTGEENELVSSLNGVFELPGEPAIVINGLPPICPSDANLFPCEVLSDIGSHKNTCFGEWLEGREVCKLFGEQLYRGKVTEFDKESGWYRVVYEDGDFEDLEWPELEEVLVPLDIMVPLKTLATKIIRRRQKTIQKSLKTGTRAKIQSGQGIGSMEMEGGNS